MWPFSSSGSAPSGLPDRSAREQCWTARDAYFDCLTAKGVNVPGQEEGKCAKEHKAYGNNCAKSWVEYFNKRRVLQIRQDLMEKQAADQRAAGGPITGERV